MRKIRLLTAIVTMVLIVACQRHNQDQARSPTETSAAPASPSSELVSANRPTDEWLGQWIGPEGTYLLLSRNGDKYMVKIQSLDGPATYEGVATGDRIQFERQGKTESIHAGSGEETGMKWLLDKKNCLIIQASEGFCRN